MSTFGVSREKEEDLRSLMRHLKVFEKDIDESFIRSSGSGGQNVNKVSTCVQLIHRPTGIIVKCQKERTQGMNRFFARRLLLQKIDRIQKDIQRKEKQRIEKIRRQKRKRSKKAKERILESKRHRSEKKSFRKKVNLNRLDRL